MGSIAYSSLPEWQWPQITPWLRINPEDILMWLKHLWEHVRHGKTKHCGKQGSPWSTSVGRPQEKEVVIHKGYTLFRRHKRTSSSPWPCLNMEGVSGFHRLPQLRQLRSRSSGVRWCANSEILSRGHCALTSHAGPLCSKSWGMWVNSTTWSQRSTTLSREWHHLWIIS